MIYIMIAIQGRIHDFKLGGAHLKKLRRAEGGAKILGVFRVKNNDLTPKNHIFSNFRWSARRMRPTPLDPPLPLFNHILSFGGVVLVIVHGSWIYNYLCNQCLPSLTLRVRIPLRRGVPDTTLCENVCQWLTVCRWFSPCTSVSSTNKIDHHDITEILLKKTFNTKP